MATKTFKEKIELFIDKELKKRKTNKDIGNDIKLANALKQTIDNIENNNIPAFPKGGLLGLSQKGMELRDYFAIRFYAIISKHNEDSIYRIMLRSYEYADKMLKARQEYIKNKQ